MIILSENQFDTATPLSDVLSCSTIPCLNKAFSMMGRRFVGKPRKAQIVQGIVRYIKEHPQEVVAHLNSESLYILKQLTAVSGDGSFVLPSIGIVNQLQEMLLVLTYEDAAAAQSYLYVTDEVAEALKPHLEEAYLHPSQTLNNEMAGFLESIAKQMNQAEDKEGFQQRILYEATVVQLQMEYTDSIEKLALLTKDKKLDDLAEAQLHILHKQMDESIRSMQTTLHEVTKYQAAGVPLKCMRAEDLDYLLSNVQEAIEGMQDLKLMIEAVLGW